MTSFEAKVGSGEFKLITLFSDEAESKRKLIPNVFAHGDLAFLSGDLMRVDKYGWCYFERRTGDTYRWKGENISTVTIESAGTYHKYRGQHLIT